MSSKVIFKNISLSKEPAKALFKVVKTTNVLDTNLIGQIYSHEELKPVIKKMASQHISCCLLYTSDAADE